MYADTMNTSHRVTVVQVESGPRTAPQPTTSRERRLMVPLSDDEDRALKQLRVDDGLPSAARIRAMLHVYLEDSAYRRKVDKRAKALR